MIETQIQRARPWFGQYHLCAKVKLADAYILRGLDHVAIDDTVTNRRRWATIRVNHGGSWRTTESMAVSEQQQQDLHAMCDFLLQQAAPYKITLAGNRMYLYTNDRPWLERLERLPVGTVLEITSIDLKGDPNAVNLQQSEHAWRSYFRTQKIDPPTLQSLKAYLSHQDIRIGPGLRWALDNQCQRLYNYYFIDYSSPATVTMMELIRPGMIRQTLPISAAK